MGKFQLSQVCEKVSFANCTIKFPANISSHTVCILSIQHYLHVMYMYMYHAVTNFLYAWVDQRNFLRKCAVLVYVQICVLYV